jgi:putative addiction module component (TIGR02574 family)
MTQHFDPALLRALPVAERLKLIEELWDSLEAESANLPLSDWQRDLVDQRLEALDSGASVGSTWDDVRRRITGKP